LEKSSYQRPAPLTNKPRSHTSETQDVRATYSLGTSSNPEFTDLRMIATAFKRQNAPILARVLSHNPSASGMAVV
jgi:hypothetical protein